MTQQEVIKKFMKLLDKTTKKGEAALNAAIKSATGSTFTTFKKIKAAMIKDAKNAKSNGEDFLKVYCGIDYDTEDTGAITGSDAGGSTTKTEESVVPESGSLKTYKKTSFTKKGLTVNLGDGKTYSDLTATEKFIWNGLYTWWIEGALDLIEESYGTNFGFGKKSSATVKEMSVTFNEDEFPAATYSTYYLDTGKTAMLNLNINMNYWDTLKNNFGKTVAHEMTHAAMKANVLLEPTYYSLPGFVREGLAELTIGVKNSRADLIKNLTAADFESGLDVNNTGTNESFMYEGGFTFFRYLARQTGDLTIENTKDSSVKTFYGNDSVKNFVSKAKIDTGAGDDYVAVGSAAKQVTIESGAGDDFINNWGSSTRIVTASGDDTIHNSSLSGGVYISSGSGDDSINSSGDNATIYGGNGDDSIWSYGLKATIKGDSGDDYIVGGESVDKIYGGADDDSLWGEGGNDVLYGDAGNDQLVGGEGKDKLYGGSGSDSLWGGAGNDSLFGGAGDDTFAYTVNQGTDRIYDWESGDMLKIFTTDGSRGSFKSSKYSGGDLTLTISGGGKVIFNDVSSSDRFNINGTTYKISGSKLK